MGRLGKSRAPGRSHRIALVFVFTGLVALAFAAWFDPGDPHAGPSIERASQADRGASVQDSNSDAAPRRTSTSVDGPELAETAPTQSPDVPAYEPADYSQSDAFTRAPMSEPREIRGRVVRGRAPVANAQVSAWRPPEGRTMGPPNGVAFRTRSDADGCFTLRAVDPGPWVVGARWREALTVSRTEVTEHGAHGGRGVLLVFGSSQINVDVFDEIGTALAGIEARVNGVGPAPSRAQFVRTGSSARAAFRDLVAGRYYVQAETPSKSHQMMVELADGEVRHVVLGNEAPPVLWRGRIVGTDGVPVRLQSPLRLVHAERRDERWWRHSGDSFEVEVPPGPWELWRRNEGLGLRDLVARVDVPNATLDQDLVLPGVRLIVEMPSESAGANVRLRPLHSADDYGPDLTDDRRVVFLCLPAGAHVLRIESGGMLSEFHGSDRISDRELRVEITGERASQSVKLDLVR